MSTGNRYALIITNSEYDDKRLSRLTTPDADGTGLANVLKDPEICQFDQVDLLQNANSGQIRIAIANFYRNRKKDDLLLLYFSGHGILDNDRQLYLAVKDTNSESDLVSANGIPSNYVNRLIDNSRSRRQIVMLDCCHSGAFARGSKAANNHRVNTGDAFDHNGYGTYVITATDTLQYAWEGDKLEGRYERSLFTHHVVEGLRTGQADIDQSGQITIENLYHYVHDRVREDGDEVRRQTPSRWINKEIGSLVIARNPVVINEPPSPQYQGELPLSEMRKIMLVHLEAEDLNDIAFDLNILELALGENPADDVRQILAKLDERDQLPKLMGWLWQNKSELCQVLFGDEALVSLKGRPKPKAPPVDKRVPDIKRVPASEEELKVPIRDKGLEPTPKHRDESAPTVSVPKRKKIEPDSLVSSKAATEQVQGADPDKHDVKTLNSQNFIWAGGFIGVLLLIGLVSWAIMQNRIDDTNPQISVPSDSNDEWIAIPAGPFYFGAAEGDTDADDDESPADPSFDIPYDYWIAKHETTNAQYKLFIDETGHSAPDCVWKWYGIPGGLENHPVVCVSWNDAIAYVNWLNGKLEDSGYEAMLPNEPEWEKAARGAEDDRLYPWGDGFDGNNLNYSGTNLSTNTAVVGSYPNGASSYGVEDMAGNVWEWTRSKYVGYPYDSNDGREELSGNDMRVLRGGSWHDDQRFVRVSDRGWYNPNNRVDLFGFRVVLVRPPSQ